MRWDPNTLDKIEKRKSSIIPKWEMFLQIVRNLKDDLETGPKDESKAVVRLSLYKLAKDFGMHCEDRHDLIYWYCKNPPNRKVFAWQIQVGSYSKQKAEKLLGNTAIYRNVIDIKENGTVEIIPLTRRDS